MYISFRRLKYIVCFVCIAFDLCAFDFIAGGKALFEIILPTDAVEMRAAAEVAENVNLISGCRPAVIGENDTRSLQNAIYIGQTLYAKSFQNSHLILHADAVPWNKQGECHCCGHGVFCVGNQGWRA